MTVLNILSAFDWNSVLLGAENWAFLLETLLRTFIMFIVILVGLRLLGKRGVKQLSIFELVAIISLGSAAGDPMLYKDVGVLPAVLVFVVIIILYTIVTWLIGRNKVFERLMEGKPITLIKDGVFSIQNFSKEALGADEFFAELRIQGVSQLGQIEEAIIESSGDISIFYYKDEEVKYGLPIMPNTLDKAQKKISDTDFYACVFCGFTDKLKPVAKHSCPECKKIEWVKASNKLRIR
ncbi:MAG: DUF421 domain-containing protein [Bacteroidetes bacterium]|nr:DUF421 domain-containing protein [Bacteroidota bacterium]